MPVAPIAPPVHVAAPAPVAGPRAPFQAALAARLAPAAARPPAPPGPHASTRATAALEAVERAQSRLEAVLAQARSGRTFTASELLGLQAEAYRAVQVVDLAGKLVEQGAQSVRQALNTQV